MFGNTGRASNEVIALSILAAAEVAHSFSAFMPSAFTTKTLALQGDPAEVAEKVANLRSGYLPATAFGLILGGVVSFLARSPLPLIMGAGTAAVMIALYETNLPRPMRLTNLGAMMTDRRTQQPIMMIGTHVAGGAVGDMISTMAVGL